MAGRGLIDPSRGMAGHSAAAQPPSPRCWLTPASAPADMDGATYAPIPDHGLAATFLFLAKQSYTPGSGGAVTTWDRDWKRLTGWNVGSVAACALEIEPRSGRYRHRGRPPRARSLDITRAYVRAFFDQHLRSEPQALLDQPSPRYPEVTFCPPD